MGYGAQRNAQNDGIAHRWAHQLPNPAKRGEHAGTLTEYNKGRNFYREGLTIYSYGRHFPIASLHKKKGAKNWTVLFTLLDYSQSTSAHKWTVRSATSHLDKIYCNDPENAINGIHSGNLRHWEEKAKKNYEHIATARKPEKYFDAISALREELQKYCKYFGLTKKNSEVFNTLQYVWKKPSAKTLAEARERAKKEAEANAKKEAERELREKQLAETRAKAEPLVIDAWKNFKPYIGQGLPLEGLMKGEEKVIHNLHHHIKSPYAFLRANMDKKEIETSMGIQVPFDVAQRFYKWLIHKKLLGGCNGDCDHKILGYDVRQVNDQGFEVGCHNILWTEADTIAKKLNW